MRDILIFFYFLMIFLNFLVIGMTNRERHQETLDAIQKLEYKVDSLQIKYDSIQNTIRKINKNV